jgi:DNA-binding CsgD family transcriptional regulator
MVWGRYGEARQRLTTALQLNRRQHYPHNHALALVTLAHLDWFTGAWESLAGRAAALARLYLMEDRAADAVALTDDPMRLIAGKGIWLWATEVAPVRTQALAATGRSGEAARLGGAFARGLRGRDAPAPRPAVLTCRAILAQDRGDPGRAAALSGRAASAWHALPRPYDALLARERQGRCLLTAGQHETGLAMLSEAYHGLSDLGAAGDAGRVARSLREHGVQARSAWRGGRPGYGGQLSPRELEVVRLVIAGYTNRQIAETISRSPHTVHMQVNSAMRKLNVTSRTALAVSAIKAGVAAGDEPRGEGNRSPVGG